MFKDVLSTVCFYILVFILFITSCVGLIFLIDISTDREKWEKRLSADNEASSVQSVSVMQSEVPSQYYHPAPTSTFGYNITSTSGSNSYTTFHFTIQIPASSLATFLDNPRQLHSDTSGFIDAFSGERAMSGFWNLNVVPTGVQTIPSQLPYQQNYITFPRYEVGYYGSGNFYQATGGNYNVVYRANSPNNISYYGMEFEHSSDNQAILNFVANSGQSIVFMRYSLVLVGQLVTRNNGQIRGGDSSGLSMQFGLGQGQVDWEHEYNVLRDLLSSVELELSTARDYINNILSNNAELNRQLQDLQSRLNSALEGNLDFLNFLRVAFGVVDTVANIEIFPNFTVFNVFALFFFIPLIIFVIRMLVSM